MAEWAWSEEVRELAAGEVAPTVFSSPIQFSTAKSLPA
jgi:hypothetical protein